MEPITAKNIERVYTFKGERHMVGKEEWNAIHRSGNPHSCRSYASDPTVPEMVHGAIHHMYTRPGQTEPGGSAVYREYTTAEAKEWLENSKTWKRQHNDWTWHELQKLCAMRESRNGGGYAWWHIAESLQRSPGACRDKYCKMHKS